MPRGAIRSFAVVLSLAAACAARAQDSSRRGAPGDFDFYVLALSWSPGFCALEGDRRGLGQCEPGSGLGFVVHGLWPQYERGYPSDCDPFDRSPPRSALQEADGVFPDERLARYEWRKHGTCSGKSPSDYFRDARRARDRIRVPERFRAAFGGGALRAIEIERAFAEANPGLRPDMMSVVCRRGVLQEVRICLERDLRAFRRCPEVDRPSCGFGPVRINAAR